MVNLRRTKRAHTHTHRHALDHSRSASGPGSSLRLLLLLKLFYCKHCLSLLVSSWSAKSPHPLFAEESWLPVLKLQGLIQTDNQNIVGKIHYSVVVNSWHAKTYSRSQAKPNFAQARCRTSSTTLQLQIHQSLQGSSLI